MSVQSRRFELMTVFIFTVSFRCLSPGVYQCKFVSRKLNHQTLFYMLKLASPNSELSYMKHDVPTSHPFWAVSYCHCSNFCFFLVIACFLISPNFRFSSAIRFCGTLGRCWMSQPCVCGFMFSYRSKKKKKSIHQKKYISVFIEAFVFLLMDFLYFFYWQMHWS